MSDDLAYLQRQNQNERLAVPLLRLAGAVQAALAWQQKVCLLTLSWLSLCIIHPDSDSTISYDVEYKPYCEACGICWVFLLVSRLNARLCLKLSETNSVGKFLLVSSHLCQSLFAPM